MTSKCTPVAALADSHWTLGAVIEQKLSQMPFTLALSGLYNLAKQKASVGIGFIVGGA